VRRRRPSGSTDGAPARRRRRRRGGGAPGGEGDARAAGPAPAARGSGPETEAVAPAPAAEDEAGDEQIRVVDPTHVLLSGMRPVRSRVPWIALGLAVVAALWIPIFAGLAVDPVRPAEVRWVDDALAPAGQHSAGSAFALALTRTAWRLQGTDPRGARLDTPGARRAVRAPFAVAGVAATVIFLVLARLMVGPAAAVAAAALLAAGEPWTRAGGSALPLVVGEMMVLLGVLWAMALQARHREVGVAGITAGSLGIAGIFLGVGILLTPAAFATFVATLMIWLLVGIRRSRADATTLQMGSPARTVIAAVAGSVVFLAGSLLAVTVAERIAGGTGLPALVPDGGALQRGVRLWSELYEMLLSPGPTTDLLLVAALALIALIRLAEWLGGRPWHAAGMAPWLFLGLWILALERDGKAGALEVPVTVPPLFVLGLGWLVLRGLHPGQFRRQEYTFLLVWLGVSLAMVPLVPGSHPHAHVLAAAVTLLPPMLLLVGRAARVMWRGKTHPLARAGILLFTALPVAWSVAITAAEAAGGDVAEDLADAGEHVLPAVLAASAALGVVAELMTVRPDPTGPPPRPRPEADPRRGPRRRGGRRRTAGGPRRGGRGRRPPG
jgi:hypothetical protein